MATVDGGASTVMRIKPEFLSIGFLFGNNFIFRVPKYQRYYAWEDEEVQDFIGDLDACVKARLSGTERKHFFGGLVTVGRDVPGRARVDHEVIDGQQRLASFVMLAAQLRQHMHRLADSVDRAKENSPEVFLAERAKELEDGFLSYRDKVELSIVTIARLELSKPDRAFFADLISGKSPTLSRPSHRRLKAAYDAFGAYLSRIISAADGDVAKASALSAVDDAFTQDWTVIHMATNSRDAAYRLFQVLNDRGTGLTEGELLRARTLEMLDSGGARQQQDQVEEAWDEILGSDAHEVDECLRWIFTSHQGVRPGKTSMFDDFLRAFFPMHVNARVTAEEAEAIVATVERIRIEFGRAQQLRLGDWPYALTPQVVAWDRDRLQHLIVHLGHTTCMPLLISACELTDQQFAEVAHVLERFVFRYKIIVGAHIVSAANIYNAQAVAIRKNSGAYRVEKQLTEPLRKLIAERADDIKFTNRLREWRYAGSAGNRTIRYFLVTLESFIRWFEDGAPGKPMCRDKTILIDFASTTLDHIYPDSADPKDAALEPLKDTLGNLTILGPRDNEASGNKPFALKRRVFEASSYMMNRKIAEEATWNETAVRRRQQLLEDLAVNVFVL